MTESDVKKEIIKIAGKENVLFNEPMSSHTSFKAGGPADILVMPENAGQVIRLARFLKKEGIPFFVMGNGTNLLVRDKGMRCVVIKTADRFNKYSVEDCAIRAESGILLSRLSEIAMEKGLTGLEFASGIPGTLGGAVAMNAGAYGGEMKDVVTCTGFIDENGNEAVLKKDDHQFGYRESAIQKKGGIVLESTIQLKRGNADSIKSLMDDFNNRRRDKQPLDFPSAGSIFRRPEGHYTGKLVEDCGLKGSSRGGAEVSCKHCGFIVNSGDASSSDIIGLIKHIQKTVHSKFNVELKTEVKIIGEE